jgi:hypothetical protein
MTASHRDASASTRVTPWESRGDSITLEQVILRVSSISSANYHSTIARDLSRLLESAIALTRQHLITCSSFILRDFI